MRVVWQFRPVEHVTRTFVLNYRCAALSGMKGMRMSSSGGRRRASTATGIESSTRDSSSRFSRNARLA